MLPAPPLGTCFPERQACLKQAPEPSFLVAVMGQHKTLLFRRVEALRGGRVAV